MAFWNNILNHLMNTTTTGLDILGGGYKTYPALSNKVAQYLTGSNAPQTGTAVPAANGPASKFDTASGAPTAPQGAQQTSTDQILQQLQAMQDPSRYMIDQGSLQAQAQAMANSQYDPVIASLRDQATQATNRGERNQQHVINTFNNLSDSLHQDLPAINQNYDQTKQNSSQEYNNLQDSIKNQYAQSQQQQEDLYKRLNIQAAAPDAIPLQTTNRDYFLNRAKTDSQNQQSALTTEQQGANDFTNRNSQIARTEGAQRSSDIGVQLGDLLNQYNSQIGAQQSAKANAYTSGLMSLWQQNQKFALDRTQNDFTNYLAAANFGKGLQNDQVDQYVKMAQLQQNPVKSIADLPRRILGMGLPATSAQKIQDTFAGSLADPMVSSGFNPVTGVGATPESKVSRMVEMGKQQGLSPQELQALQLSALEYFGRG